MRRAGRPSRAGARPGPGRRPVLLSTAATVCLALAFPFAARGATFSFTGAEQTFTVPAGVTTLPVTAIGGGGSGEGITTGGRAGIASGTLAVTPGELLYIEVGGSGVGLSAPFNGGGASGSLSGSGKAGAGGGASDVRTVPRASGAASLPSRLVIAAGGGGAVDLTAGGDAGAAGGGASGGGGPGTQTAGGSGGANTVPTGSNGKDGSLGSGGDGGFQFAYFGGGGGGGGLYGGGGGSDGGGGGGSSHTPSGGTTGLAAAGAAPSVQITTPAVNGPATAPGKQAGTVGTGGAALSRYVLSNSTFAAASSGPSAGAARRRAKVGTTVRYTLSAAAAVTFTVERAAAGRRVTGRCRKSSRKNRKRRKCVRYVRVKGSFTQPGSKARTRSSSAAG